MSESVEVISSHPITFDEFSEVIIAASGKPRTSPSENKHLGTIEDGKRHVLIFGYRNPTDDVLGFWASELPYLGLELLEEMQTKLGANPVLSYHVEVGTGYRSGLLAVEFAFCCAERWPCVVLADVVVNGRSEAKVYTREEIIHLHGEGKAFTTYGMLEDYDEE